MKTTSFRYQAVQTLEEAYALLAAHAETAKIIAGGQSLVPMMNFRMVSPDVLIDINSLAELRLISEDGDHLRIGALARHRDVETSELVKQHAPLLTQAVQLVAHQAVRNRGTFGGSLCHADPSAEFPACAVLLGATMELGSVRGVREVAASEFFLGTFTTALEPDELLIGIRLPKRRVGERFAFRELSRRHGDFAMAGVGVAQLPPALVSSGGQTRWVVFGVADHPVLMPMLAKLFEAGLHPVTDEKAIARAIAEDLDGLVSDNENLRLQIVLTTELVLRCAEDLFNDRLEVH
jgi:carbon-monoxide dehydrogenase medium subunit